MSTTTIRLATNEVPDGDNVCAAPVRLSVLEWLEGRHECLVERWQSDPYPMCRGVRRSDAPIRRKIASSLIQAHARLVWLRTTRVTSFPPRKQMIQPGRPAIVGTRQRSA